MSRKPRQERATFSLAAVRRREVERHARHVGAADTEDFWRWLVAWSWHNRDSRDNAGALVLAAERMGGTLSGDEAVKALDQADDMPQHRSADRLARFLGVTFPQRQVLGIKTIGAIDLNRRARLFLRGASGERATSAAAGCGVRWRAPTSKRTHCRGLSLGNKQV